MSSWPLAGLGEVAQFINGKAFKPSDWSEQGRRIVRIQNLTDPAKIYNRTKCTVPERFCVSSGELLVSWSATLGVFEWEGPDTALVNQHIFRVVPDEAVIDKRYLKHIMVSALVNLESHLHGATMKHVNRAEFLQSTIPLPPLEEQRRIARVLDAADGLRAKRRKYLRHLHALVGAIYTDLFHGEWRQYQLGDVLAPIVHERSAPRGFRGAVSSA